MMPEALPQPAPLVRFTVAKCSLGAILVAVSEKGICAVRLGDDPDELACRFQERFPQAVRTRGSKDLDSLIAGVVGLFDYNANPPSACNLPLDLRGTAFQQKVWQALIKIPFGKTATYTAIAESLGMPRAVRAVANACGDNPVAVLVPCHRVVRSDGTLSGYRWGVERKRALLEREKALSLAKGL